MLPSLHYLNSEAGEAHRLACWLWNNPQSEAPALLCVHGLTRNGRDFDYLAYAMSEHYQVLCPDMPGRGKSDWLTNTQHYNYDTYLTDILALLDSRKIKQVDWLGTSMGGILGMRVAAERPELIRKLMLNDIGAVIPLAGLSRINGYVGLSMMFSDREQAEAYLRKTFATFGINREEHWQHMLEHSFTQLSNGEYQLAYDPGILDPLRDQAKKLAQASDTLLWGWWDKIQCPVLVIRGETSDILLAETAEEMTKRHPQTSLLTIPSTGHAPALMEEEQIHIVKEWLLA